MISFDVFLKRIPDARWRIRAIGSLTGGNLKRIDEIDNDRIPGAGKRTKGKYGR
jgi:hypothetical protein